MAERDDLTELRARAMRKMLAQPRPDAAPVIYEALVDIMRLGPLEYGLMWIPDLIELLAASPDVVNEALDWMTERKFVDLYWAPGTYREDGTFDLDPGIAPSQAKMLRPGICGGRIGYVRIRNDHPWRGSKDLPGWADVARQAWLRRTGSEFVAPTTEQEIHELLRLGAPLIVSWGIGRDSTAMLVQFARVGLRPDAILYAEVGNEKPETYAYRPYFEQYLGSVGFPRVQTVKYQVPHGGYCTLEQECLYLGALPSIAYGYSNRKCSAKWKVVPQEKFVRGMPIAHAAWRKGLPVVRAVGFDASPEDLKRRDRAVQNEMFVNWYPMQDWKWDLERVIAEIQRAGLRVPVKSACFFCSASKPHEVEELIDEHPEYIERIEAIEQRGKLKTIKAEGLWFSSTKARPGSWTEFIRRYRRTGARFVAPPKRERKAKP